MAGRAPVHASPQTDVSRSSTLPTPKSLQRPIQPSVDQDSDDYLDGAEEQWNRCVDVEVETLVNGMVDIVALAAVRARRAHPTTLKFTVVADLRQGQTPHHIGDVPSTVPRSVHGASACHWERSLQISQVCRTRADTRCSLPRVDDTLYEAASCCCLTKRRSRNGATQSCGGHTP